MPKTKNGPQPADHPWRKHGTKNNYPTAKLANYVGDPLPEIFGEGTLDLSNCEHAEKIC